MVNEWMPRLLGPRLAFHTHFLQAAHGSSTIPIDQVSPLKWMHTDKSSLLYNLLSNTTHYLFEMSIKICTCAFPPWLIVGRQYLSLNNSRPLWLLIRSCHYYNIPGPWTFLGSAWTAIGAFWRLTFHSLPHPTPVAPIPPRPIWSCTYIEIILELPWNDYLEWSKNYLVILGNWPGNYETWFGFMSSSSRPPFPLRHGVMNTWLAWAPSHELCHASYYEISTCLVACGACETNFQMQWHFWEGILAGAPPNYSIVQDLDIHAIGKRE